MKVSCLSTLFQVRSLTCDIAEKIQKIVDWLSPLSFSDRHYDVLSRRCEGTGQWLLETREASSWLMSGDKASLWCSGIRKTILAKDYMLRSANKAKRVVCHLIVVWASEIVVSVLVLHAATKENLDDLLILTLTSTSWQDNQCSDPDRSYRRKICSRQFCCNRLYLLQLQGQDYANTSESFGQCLDANPTKG